jgi:hypothetical protein
MSSLNLVTIQTRRLGNVLARIPFFSRLIVLQSSLRSFSDRFAAHSPHVLISCWLSREFRETSWRFNPFVKDSVGKNLSTPNKTCR